MTQAPHSRATFRTQSDRASEEEHYHDGSVSLLPTFGGSCIEQDLRYMSFGRSSSMSMREKSSHRQRQKDCRSRPSGSASVRGGNSAEEGAASISGLVDEMEASFAAARERAVAEGEGEPLTSGEEIKAEVSDANRGSLRRAGIPPRVRRRGGEYCCRA